MVWSLPRETMLFRVIITPDDIRRVSVESLPETVDELVNILRQELGLQGKSFDSLEVDRCALENEMKKKKVAWKQVDALMDNTFSLRRKEVISEVPLVKDVKKRWPALFTQRQVAAEFRRIMAKDLGKAFFDGLDEYVPTFLQLYRERCSGDGALKCLVESLDADVSLCL
ncbi:uncharacterized protein LOC130567450 isoform X4 [Triplophysa rosa]|uniref:uncharacterized protein LOC130567450 isoform X4 n=1 Tax=Triplophysa rosa TaxID=992332 RepID=UPI002545FB96|nr:uncharacterized protein LOC130567450 isoform X4 [Triplophysa rosa]